MLKDLLLPSRELVSIEIGSEFLKLIHFRRAGTGGKILNLISKDIRTLSDDDITSWIKEYLTKQRIKSETSLSIITPRYSINKNIELPSTDPTEIKDIIKLQASRHTPYAREEIEIDYIPTGTFKGGYTKVLLVIVNRDVIKKQQDIIERAGLRLKKSVLSVEAITQWYYDTATHPGEGSICLLHFDYGSIDFIVTSGGKPVFVRSIPLGVYELLHEPQHSREKFIEELRSSAESYQTESIADFDRVVLLGAVDNLEDLTSQIEGSIGKKTSRESYLDRISLTPEAISAKEAVSPEVSFLPAISTALRYRKVAVDFTPEEIRLREAMAEKSREIIFTGTLVMFILILIAIVVAKNLSDAIDYLDHITKKYETMHHEAKELKAMKEKTVQAKDFLAKSTYALDIITEVYRVIPDKIYLTRFNLAIKEDNKPQKQEEFIEEFFEVVITGVSETNPEVFNFVAVLEQSPLFKRVWTEDSTHRIIKEKERFDFEIVCQSKEPISTKKITEK